MLTLFSPAKLNLFLLILGKRSDGYHELASLMQTIDLGDQITFTLASEDRIRCSDPNLPCGPTNLISKAVALFRRKTGLNHSISIEVEKKIPIEAGLGGGSSNGATTLWALNALHGHPVKEEELQSWSAEMGSDLPFFFSHGTAYCTGRGENVKNLPPLTFDRPLFLYKPKEGLSTVEVYRALQLATCAPLNPEKLIEEFYGGEPLFHNDLEEPAFRLLPELYRYKTELQAQGITQITLSGSGSALFGFGKGTNALRCINRTANAWYTSDVASGN